MKVFLLALLLLAIGVAGMAVTILFKKDGKFPDGEIAHNKALREQGIICAKEEEMRLWRKRNPSAAARGERPAACPEGGCEGCAFFEISKPH
ncbi:MAG: hypothetical protein IKH24_10210 [Bacteroidales bacterium]|jgi:hypothetical protein|nr:hypothetical protein [Bacteroidales bacterium]MBR3451191.1 hypothetical protein [Bacteroidales bacterium]